MFNRAISPWWSVAAGAIGGVLAAGPLMIYAYGILARPMGAEFGWDRAVLAQNVTAFMIGNGIGLALLGWLIARYGIRLPSALFVAVFGLCFAGVGLLPAEPRLFLALFFVMGIGGAAGTALPYAVAISGFFDARRGLALGLVVAGSGLGATLQPQAAQFLTDHHGWRAAFAVIGLVAGLGAVLVLTLLVRTPAGAWADEDAAAERTSFVQHLASRHFWLIGFAILAVSVAAFGAMVSLVPLFTDRHIDPSTATAIISAAGLASWVGRLAVGYLLDRMFAPLLTAIVFLLAALGLVFLATTSSVPFQYLGAALVSLALGAEADLLAYLISRYFRLADFSRVTGIIWVVWTWGGSLGIAVASRTYAAVHNYMPAFIGFAITLAIAAGLIGLLGPYRDPVHRDDAAETDAA